MSSNFRVDLTHLGLKNNYLYEILATTYSIKNNKFVPNTAAMGIRLLDDNTITISPFPNTATYKNLETTKLIILNFVDDIYLYALASLKDNYISNSIETLTEKHYKLHPFEVKNEHKTIFEGIMDSNKLSLPYLNQAWAIVSCIVMNKNQTVKKDNLGQVELVELSLSVISYEKFKESFKLYNRAENLALETIVLATKLYVAKEKENKTLFNKILNKIEENINEVLRFGKNKSALKAIECVKGYVSKLRI